MLPGLFRKRDVFVALTIGSVIAFGLNIWYNAVATPERIDDYLWLSQLQEPGARLGLKVVRSLYPVIGRPWCVRLGIVCGYAVLVGMWTIVVYCVAYISRLALSIYHARFARQLV
jgi:hypothetical protein